MSDNETRVHDFTDASHPRLAPLSNLPDVRRAMARTVSDYGQDISAEIEYAKWLDQIGADDVAAGNAYTAAAAVSSDPRPVIERVLMAVDLLRQAQRTMH